MTRLILDIESSLSPGTLFERASQALRECKLTADWEIQQGKAFEVQVLPAAAASPQPCEHPKLDNYGYCEECEADVCDPPPGLQEEIAHSYREDFDPRFRGGC